MRGIPKRYLSQYGTLNKLVYQTGPTSSWIWKETFLAIGKPFFTSLLLSGCGMVGNRAFIVPTARTKRNLIMRNSFRIRLLDGLLLMIMSLPTMTCGSIRVLTANLILTMISRVCWRFLMKKRNTSLIQAVHRPITSHH